MSSAVSKSRPWNTVGAVALFILCAAVLGFRSPGMFYDEAIFFNGAVQVLSSAQEPSFAHDPWSWITIFGRRWPIMVMPYVGPIRDYLALVPFAIFGPNYYTARILTTCLGAFAIWGFSVLIRNQVNPQAASLTSWILAIHPAYLALTIYQGAVVEWMVPFGVLSIALARFLKVRTTGSAFWLGAAMGFGVWSRANIAWLLGSALLAGVIVLGRRILIPWRQLTAIVGGGIAGAAPLLWYEIRSYGATFEFMRSTNNPEPLTRLALHRLNLLSQTLLSDSELRKMWNGPALPLWQTILFSSIVLAALCACLLSSRTAFGRAAALTFLFLLACMLLTPLNVSDHHLIALVPIAALLVVIAGQYICAKWKNAKYVVGLIAITYLGCALYWNTAAARQIRSTGGVGYWSNAIDTLAGYLQRNCQGRPIKVLDWGLNNNLFVLSNAKIASLELFWGATVERSGSGKLWIEEIAPGDVYVLHAPGLVAFPDAEEGFRRALRASARPFRRTEFVQKDGAGYAEVLEIR